MIRIEMTAKLGEVEVIRRFEFDPKEVTMPESVLRTALDWFSREITWSKADGER